MMNVKNSTTLIDVYYIHIVVNKVDEHVGKNRSGKSCQ